jgi:hypothetical protein
MSTFHSEDGKIPEIDLKKLDHITSIITTFEEKDLKTKNTISFFFDKNNDYVFLELQSSVNGKVIVDDTFGYDKEKILTICNNLLSYFKNS